VGAPPRLVGSEQIGSDRDDLEVPGSTSRRPRYCFRFAAPASR